MSVVTLRRCAAAPQPKNLHHVGFEILHAGKLRASQDDIDGRASVTTYLAFVANFALQSRQDDAALRLVLPFFVLVADFAVFVAHEEQHLA